MPYEGQVQTFGDVDYIYGPDGWTPVAEQPVVDEPEDVVPAEGIPGALVMPDINDPAFDLTAPIYDEYGNTVGEKIVGRDVPAFNKAMSDYLDQQKGDDGGAGYRPQFPSEKALQEAQAAAIPQELEIAREELKGTNIASHLDAMVAEMTAEIDARRLTTEQAIEEFNKRLDALSEAGTQYEGMFQYSVAPGTTHTPGYAPGGLGEKLGYAPRPMTPIHFDPFATAVELIEGSPDFTEIGAPSMPPDWDEALAIAASFAGV